MAKCGVVPGGWCGECYANIKGRSNHKGHRGYHAPRSPRMGEYMAWLKKESGSGASGVQTQAAEDAAFCKAYPALWEFVSMTAWEDGSLRKTGSLLSYLDDGKWKGMLKCKETSRICFVTAQTHSELLRVLEKGLETGGLDWRKEKPFPARRG